jgi:hypothetical protein
MDTDSLRALVREKLQSGRLPFDNMSRFWSGPANGEVCDACDKPITKQQLVMESVSNRPTDKKPFQLHITCFQMWDVERRDVLKS